MSDYRSFTRSLRAALVFFNLRRELCGESVDYSLAHLERLFRVTHRLEAASLHYASLPRLSHYGGADGAP